MSKVRDILGVDKESEFLQSFVRIGLSADQEDNDAHKSIYAQSKPKQIVINQSLENRSEASDGRSPRRTHVQFPNEITIPGKKIRRRRREYYEEMYTDKDRAAAVSYG